MSRTRALALGALLGALAAYTAWGGALPDLSYDGDVAVLVALVIPATLLAIWLALPLLHARGLLLAALAFGALALVARAADLDVLFNLSKLCALTLAGLVFLSFFDNVLWAALVAVLIPWVDALSVWRGPTEYVVEERPGLFQEVAVAFRVPGEDNAAYLGPPDILFFALFLGAAARFGLRVPATWLAMTALLGATLVLTAYTDVAGLPALPAIALGFLLPNADRIWTALRRRGRAPARIYGRTDDHFYDLHADVIERAPAKVVLLTRDTPPEQVVLSPVDGDFADEPAAENVGAVRMRVGRGEPVDALVHDLPHGLVVVPRDEVSSYLDVVHPEQLAADEDKLERLKRERR